MLIRMVMDLLKIRPEMVPQNGSYRQILAEQVNVNEFEFNGSEMCCSNRTGIASWLSLVPTSNRVGNVACKCVCWPYPGKPDRKSDSRLR